MANHIKTLSIISGVLIFIVCLASQKTSFGQGAASLRVAPGETENRPPDYRNFYGISWRGTAHDNLAYARQMKYDYVFYQSGMEYDSLSNGLFFYLESPEYITYNRRIETGKNYSVEQKAFFQTHYALKNNTQPFPYNIATGWFFNATSFTPLLDYQQQRVIDYAIDSIKRHIQKIEAGNPKFHFGGLAWDVPQPAGDFWDTIRPSGKQITLKYWTGGDYSIKHPDVTHEYNTYSGGHIEFYKQLYSKIRQQYPAAKFIMEPYKLYENWISIIKNTPNSVAAMPDMLCQENPGVEFATDLRIYADGLITRDRVGSSTPNKYGESDNRIIAAQAAINGSWYNWFGRFGGTGDMPNYKSIKDVPPRLKLIRMLPNYENLNHTPLNARSWDGTTYQSNNAFANPKAIAVLQPETKKYFVLFGAEDAEIPLPPGRTATSIQKTNTLFIEIGEGNAELTILAGKIRPGNAASLNKVYILKLN